MEQPISNGQFVVLTKGNWQMKTSGTYTFRDNSAKGTVDIQFMKLSGQSLVSSSELKNQN
jgi:uncharacterized protein YdeI (BOF family)